MTASDPDDFRSEVRYEFPDAEVRTIDGDLAVLEIYLEQARPRVSDLERNPDAALGGQIAARRSLLRLFRRQWVEGGSVPGAHNVQPEVLDFFRQQSDAIWASPDPVSAMREYLGVVRGRGRQRTDPDKDLDLVVEVALQVNSGMAVEAACKLLSNHNNRSLTWERVREIYQEHKRDDEKRAAVNAQIAFLQERN